MSTSASHQEAGRLGLLASVTIVGLAFFAATALLLPIVSEYSLTADYISELAIGRYGYLQTAAFFAAGLGTLSLAVGVREATRLVGVDPHKASVAAVDEAVGELVERASFLPIEGAPRFDGWSS